jgi:hypothetical protein
VSPPRTSLSRPPRPESNRPTSGASGKPAKGALVAAMRRLLLILNAMLKTKTPWRSPCPAA